ncbi:MAG: helix-turn-helix domain-containing protein [Acidaminococcus sp.]|jgi:AraC family transcriptional regulator of adaptative response / DNA-3-methyladenine glycosylase II|nr:helix-turn-helix domain-containing protein [Acidaminococcus sp.]MCI2099971.1 helix-turn-helix domain-containing protein [Acidaminococcus sp.]MCI2114247.1 helix-turn-helix domain-containing protein [Acidaminococcus sp.]MCI2116239.1 helix-turn-helix domain-containing protein [Acidaminococcus sp.]
MLPNQKEACYEAFRSKDARFDGRLFVGVSSTGIYCRPVCPARVPKIENCTFFTSAAEAEKAGYRPCLLCRPELAPGQAPMDASHVLARKAARMLEENCSGGMSLAEAATYLGCSDRHLRRVFQEEFHVTPVAYTETCRLLLAKNLLTDTALSVMDVAMAAGFGSARRMNELFKKRYHLTPTQLRRKAAGKAVDQEISLDIGYRVPYCWDEIHDFLAGRAIAGVETADETSYARTVSLTSRSGKEVTGWMRVQNDAKKHCLRVTLAESLIPVLSQVLAGVRRVFDLYCDPEIVYEKLKIMNELHPGLARPGMRIPGAFVPFETAVRAILGQQITVKAAGTLAGRIAAKFGKPIETGVEGLNRIFPTPAVLLSMKDSLEDEFGKLGIIASRSRTILSLAEAVQSGEIRLDSIADAEMEMAKLKKIKGIGNWSAQYIAMRTMAYPDAFLETDIGIKRALPDLSPKKRLELAEAWRPWRSYAVINLWNRKKE